MIKVIKEKNRVTICGHAFYDEKGKDIVCASASSIIYTSINAILCIHDNAIEVIDEKDFIINILSKDELTLKLINNMIVLLQNLSEQYPKNIIVKEN